MPGPAGFLSQILEDLRAGRSVVVAVPTHGAGGLRAALRQRVADELELFEFRSLDLGEQSDLAGEPARLVRTRWAPAKIPGEILDTRSLAECQNLWGLIVWVEGFSAALWRAWKAFLFDYDACSRNRDILQRTLFCCALAGALDVGSSVGEVTVAVRRWDGQVRRRDVMLFAGLAMRLPAADGLRDELAVATIGELAGFDPTLAEFLASLPFADLLAPWPALEQFGKSRGWDAEGRSSPRWADGTLGELRGQPFVHSSFLALHGDPRWEIPRRLWRAQVAVVFPHIEEIRTRLVAANTGLLWVPFHTDFGVIEHLLDLELPHLDFQLRTARASHEVRNVVTRLKTARHCLAHLEPLSPEMVEGLCEMEVDARAASRDGIGSPPASREPRPNRRR